MTVWADLTVIIWATSGQIMVRPLGFGAARGNENMLGKLPTTPGNDRFGRLNDRSDSKRCGVRERRAASLVWKVLERWVTVSIFCLAACGTEYSRIALHSICQSDTRHLDWETLHNSPKQSSIDHHTDWLRCKFGRPLHHHQQCHRYSPWSQRHRVWEICCTIRTLAGIPFHRMSCHFPRSISLMSSILTEVTYTDAPGRATVATVFDIGIAFGACSMATTDRGSALFVPGQGRNTTFDKLGSEPPRPRSKRCLEGGYLELRRKDSGINHSQPKDQVEEFGIHCNDTPMMLVQKNDDTDGCGRIPWTKSNFVIETKVGRTKKENIIQ